MAIQHCAVQTKGFCLLSSHLAAPAVGTASLLRLFLHLFGCLGRISPFSSAMGFHQHSTGTAWSVGASHSVGSAQLQTCLLSSWTTDPAGNYSPFRILGLVEPEDFLKHLLLDTGDTDGRARAAQRAPQHGNMEQARGSFPKCHCSTLEQSSETEGGGLKTGSG